MIESTGGAFPNFVGVAESDPSERFARNFLAIVLELAVSLLLAFLEAVSLVLGAHITPLEGFAPALLQLTLGSSRIETCGPFLPQGLEVAL